MKCLNCGKEFERSLGNFMKNVFHNPNEMNTSWCGQCLEGYEKRHFFRNIALLFIIIPVIMILLISIYKYLGRSFLQ